MKKTVAVLLVLVLVIGMVGCGKSDEEITSTEKNVSDVEETSRIESEKETLVIWSFFEDEVKMAVDYFKETTGTEVDFQTASWSEHPVMINAHLDTENMPDLVVLEKSFLTRFISLDHFEDLDEIYTGRPEYEAYKKHTSAATIEPAYVDGRLKAIGWQANVSVFWYREDLAREAFGIDSVEEMEAQISTLDGLMELNELKKPGYEDVKVIGDYTNMIFAFTSQWPAYVTDGTFTFTEQMRDSFEKIREMDELGLFYANDEEMVTKGVKDNEVLGLLGQTWLADNIIAYGQDGSWRVAKGPIQFSMGGSWLAVPKGKNTELAYEFLSMTLMNEEWLYNNIESIGGYIGNQKVMDRVLKTDVKGDSYFGGQNLAEKFVEVNQEVTYLKPMTVYDKAILDIFMDVMRGYGWYRAFDDVEEAFAAIEDEIKSAFHELEIVYQ